MTTQIKQIDADARPSSGKGAARAVRRQGKVPAVLYGGDHKTAETIALDQNELVKTINRGRFLSTVFDIKVGDKVTRAIPRDVQLDPIKDTPVHVDFQRIGADNRVRIRIPMRFVNEAVSPGLKRGGVLNIVRREVEVWAPANNVPDHFEADLDGLEIGRSIHISAIALPEGVTPMIRDRDFTIATIAGAVAARADGDEGTAAAAGGEAAGGAAKAAGGAAKAAAPAAAAKGGKK